MVVYFSSERRTKFKLDSNCDGLGCDGNLFLWRGGFDLFWILEEMLWLMADIFCHRDRLAQLFLLLFLLFSFDFLILSTMYRNHK